MGGGGGGGQAAGRTDLLWRLLAEYLPEDKKTIQREIVRHVEFTLACTRLSFQKKHAFQAVAHSLRDRMVERHNDTQQVFDEKGARMLYYVSMEFLMGRTLSNSVHSLGLVGEYREALLDLGFQLEELYEEEKDAALGNGGLGRLAACFMDSLATHNYPAMGYGLRYSYGLFEQRILNNEQIELPDCWLTEGNPWEVERLDVQYSIRFYGRVRHEHQNLGGPGNSFLTHAVTNFPPDASGGVGGRGGGGGGGGGCGSTALCGKEGSWCKQSPLIR
jgi:starch phosphorylase